MKTILTKKPSAIKALLFKTVLCCCVFVLLQANKTMAQYARVELTNPGRQIDPNVIYDHCTATIALYDYAGGPYYVTDPAGMDVYVSDVVTATTGLGTSGTYTYTVHIPQGSSTADLGWTEILHYYSFTSYDAETNYNYDLNGQYTSQLSVSGDPNNVITPQDTYWDFYYDYGYTLYPGGPWW